MVSDGRGGGCLAEGGNQDNFKFLVWVYGWMLMPFTRQGIQLVKIIVANISQMCTRHYFRCYA